MVEEAREEEREEREEGEESIEGGEGEKGKEGKEGEKGKEDEEGMVVTCMLQLPYPQHQDTFAVMAERAQTSGVVGGARRT